MYAKTIEYTDFNGVERKENFLFNISEAEVIDLEMATEEGYLEMLYRIIDAKDKTLLYKEFKRFITSSYGRKSEDGRAFLKKPEWTEEFMATPAFSILISELMSDANIAGEFITAILPKSKNNPVPAPVK